VIPQVTIDAFTTPMGMFRPRLPPSFNAQLRRFIRRCQGNTKTRQSWKGGFSNLGWHSPAWTWETAPPIIRRLLALMQAAVEETIGMALEKRRAPQTNIRLVERSWTAWSVVNRTGDFNLPHIHESSCRDTWSTVYYATTGRGEGGAIRFTNPSSASRSMMVDLDRVGGQGSYVEVQPSAGLLMAFPGWLEHLVLPYQGRHRRTIVAANVGVFRFGTAP
jgi:uncharacterized protein (TIGR02466 family)